MAYSYPIWHEVSACHYRSDKSYGGKNDSRDKICVGSSAKNSYLLADTCTTRRMTIDDETGERHIQFRYYIDSVMVKGVVFKANSKGNATGEPLHIVNKIKELL